LLLTPLLFFPSTVFYLKEILFAADTIFLLFPDRLFIFFLNIYWHINSVYQGFSKGLNKDIQDIFLNFFREYQFCPFNIGKQPASNLILGNFGNMGYLEKVIYNSTLRLVHSFIR